MNQLLNVAVTGASGMLGTAILDCLASKCNVFATSRKVGLCEDGINWRQFDLFDRAKLVDWLIKAHPDVVIHCAAMVNVDACEKEAAKAQALHAETAEIISHTISNWNGRLVYISTDAVFDGRHKGFYTEEDKPNPLSVYGRTKRAGEIATLATPNGIVLRTNIFGWSQIEERYSFAEWILKGLVEKTSLRMFTDVYFSPIHVSHVADVIFTILTTKPNISGLFHLSGSTILSKFDFSIKMASVFNLGVDNIIPASIDDAGLAAERPKNMVLSNEKLSRLLNIKIQTVDEGLAYLKTQCDNGWLAKIKGRAIEPNFQFWRAA